METNTLYFAALIGIIIGSIHATDSLKMGQCPQVQPVHLHQRVFDGRWYEVKRSHRSGHSEDTKDCIFFDLTFSTDGTGWELIMNTTIYNGEKSDSSIVKADQPTDLSKTSLASFIIRIPEREEFKENFIRDKQIQKPEPNFFVLSIDDQVALFYYCQEKMGYFKDERAWILSRDSIPDLYRVFDMEQMLRLNGVDVYMEDIDIFQCGNLVDRPWTELF